MNWLSISTGKRRPEKWFVTTPNFFSSGFKANTYIPAHACHQKGRHRLIGSKFLTGDSFSIEWSPCLEKEHVALYLKVVASGIDYSYSLTSIKSHRPASISVELIEAKRIVTRVDSFEGIFSFITTHESFQKSPISIFLCPLLETPAKREINHFVLPSSIKRLRLPL